MLTLPEFVSFLNYLQENSSAKHKKIFDKITAVRDPWRGEWIDADFKVVRKKLYVNYTHQTIKGKLKPQHTERLDSFLEEDRAPGIDLKYWLKHATKQGLPPANIPTGNLYYWCPDYDNNSVARFIADSDWAYLDCGRDASDLDSSLGVRRCQARVKREPSR